jgi:hypothetical protein
MEGAHQMALRLLRLEHATRPAFEKLVSDAWGANWGNELSQALISWRYYDRQPENDTWIALDGDQCIALLDSFVRPYALDGRIISIRETCDWFCQPKYRPFGVGLKLMRQVMTNPEPMLTIGGSEATQAILPRLGWTSAPDAHRYVLPIRTRGAAATWLRRHWPRRERLAEAVPDLSFFRRPRRAPALAGGTVQIEDPDQGILSSLPLPARSGLVQILLDSERRWISRMPLWFAQPAWLAFSIDGRPVGRSFSQMEPTASGFEACIVHLEALDESTAVMNWIVSETARFLVGRGAGLIRCSASSSHKAAALVKSGFLNCGIRPSYWWHAAGTPAPSSLDAGYLRGDDALPFAALRSRRLHDRGVRSDSFRPAKRM